jgi:hypothetical protein
MERWTYSSVLTVVQEIFHLYVGTSFDVEVYDKNVATVSRYEFPYKCFKLP